jgi:hypothetical protein
MEAVIHHVRFVTFDFREKFSPFFKKHCWLQVINYTWERHNYHEVQTV